MFVCTNRRDEGHPKGSCAAKDAEGLLAALKESMAKRGLAKRFRACGSTCLDLCEIGATVVQEPGHVVYGHVTKADVDEIVSAVETGTVVHRLVVLPGDPATKAGATPGKTP